MCGIAGFTMLQRRLPDPAGVLAAMTDTLKPRGPDGAGAWLDPGVALGHRRLSIIDIQGGAQPMAVRNGQFHVVYNGEIYNYVELKAALEARGCLFQTHSDTEVLLQQYAEDGEACLSRFDGIFAFALWEPERRRLFLARDRIGVKPLYYCVVRGELVFASELKALLRHPDVGRELDMLSMSKFMTLGFIPAPHTIFRGIHKLEPGACLTFDEHGLTKRVYWDIPLQDRPVLGQTGEECAAQIRDLLADAVRKQLRSDVPVAVFLSGGIDSSTLAALAAQASPRTIQTFSIGFEEGSYDESPFARMMAERCGTEHHHAVLSQSRAIETLPRVMSLLDEPLGDASILPTYLLSEFTARHVKVALGGDGGDELFAGYASFQAHKIMERVSVLPMAWRDALVNAARRLPVSHTYASLGFLTQQFFKGAGISPEIRFFLWMGAFGNQEKRQLLAPEARAALAGLNPFEDIINYVRQSGLLNDFDRLLYLCMKLYLQDDVLVKVDRASMAHSLEVRVPFLAHPLVEYVSSLPPAHKLRGLTTKHVLRRAVRGLVPEAIIRRRKAGFSVPMATWLQGGLRDIVEDLCAESALKRDGWFDPRFVRTMLDDHYARRRDYRKEIWTLASFLMWRRQYLAA